MKVYVATILLGVAAFAAMLLFPTDTAFTLRTKPPVAPDVTQTVSKHDKDCHFAVVCGGVHSVAQLLALHEPMYDHLDRSKLHEEMIGEDIWVFMTYRKGGRVYSTKHKVLVHRGEWVITDGTYFLLERCGNLFTLDILEANPTSELEPSPAELGDISDEETVAPTENSETSTPGIDQTTYPLPSQPSLPGGGIFCCGGGGSGPAPTRVPEPPTIFLLLLALPLLGVMRRK